MILFVLKSKEAVCIMKIGYIDIFWKVHGKLENRWEKHRYNLSWSPERFCGDPGAMTITRLGYGGFSASAGGSNAF